MRVIVVGAGLSGSVMANLFATKMNANVMVIEKRDHIAGNCYDYLDENGILVNKYGAHLFHTNDNDVWSYVNKFGEWCRWNHRVVCNVSGVFVPIPTNINTINLLCGENLQSIEDMDEWLLRNQIRYEHPVTNGEEMAKSRVGVELYERLFKNYTYKQWNKYPDELNPEVLARIPVRNNHDDRYFTDKYQALPKHGYTEFVKNILHHPNIQVKLNTEYVKDDSFEADVTIFTGPIDVYFKDKACESLEYRSIRFVKENFKNMNYYQPNSVVNYPLLDVSFTRIVEYKHFLNQESPHTTIVKEYPTDEGEPYYPVLNERNVLLYEKYKKLAEDESNVHFIGRLANYKYFNMDQAIKNAIDYFNFNFMK